MGNVKVECAPMTKQQKNTQPRRIHSNALLCDCFPLHCEKFEEHGLCWCEPEIIEVEGSKIFVHQEEQ